MVKCWGEIKEYNSVVIYSVLGQVNLLVSHDKGYKEREGPAGILSKVMPIG